MKKITKLKVKKTEENKVQELEKKLEQEPQRDLDTSSKERESATSELENGDYDSEDLALGDDLSLGDFEDPEFFEEDSSEEYEEDDEEEDDTITVLYGLLGSFLEYDNQNIAELLCQIRDSIDSNSKCLLRVAHEMRSLHNTYIQNLLINTEFTEDSLFHAGDHKDSQGKTPEGTDKADTDSKARKDSTESAKPIAKKIITPIKKSKK